MESSKSRGTAPGPRVTEPPGPSPSSVLPRSSVCCERPEDGAAPPNAEGVAGAPRGWGGERSAAEAGSCMQGAVQCRSRRAHAIRALYAAASACKGSEKG